MEKDGGSERGRKKEKEERGKERKKVCILCAFVCAFVCLPENREEGGRRGIHAFDPAIGFILGRHDGDLKVVKLLMLPPHSSFELDDLAFCVKPLRKLLLPLQPGRIARGVSAEPLRGVVLLGACDK